MITERRALNEEERGEFAATALWKVDWKEVVGFAILGGGFVGVLALLVIGALLRLVGIEINGFMGLSGDRLPLFFFGVSASLFTAYIVWFEIRSRRRADLRRQQILNRNDLVVEVHSIVDCKLAREPEHGQCMYFLKSGEGRVIFVFEGQDELQENWQENPSIVVGSEKPRSELKIIRLPETKESIAVKFNGSEIPVHDCYEMTLPPNFWPASGKAIKSSWDDLPRRYKLKNMRTPVS